MPSLIQNVTNTIPPDMIAKVAGMLGESPADTASGFDAAAPALLAGALQQGSTTAGANDLLGLVRQATASGNPADRLGSILSDEHARTTYLHQGQSLATSLLGRNTANVASALNSTAHVSRGSASTILALLAPLMLGMLGRAAGPTPTASGLQSVLTTERSGILKALPSGLGSLFGLGGAPAAAATAATTKQAPSGIRRFLPWLLVALAGLVLLLGLRTCSATSPPQSVSGANPSIVAMRLPGGATINVGQNSIGYGVARFLQSPEQAPKTFVFDNLNFDTASNALTPESRPTVATLATILKAYPNAQARIVGYTDNQGDPNANLSLSDSRAMHVKEELVAAGIAGERLSTAGMGESNPIADNSTEDGRAKNRRTEFQITRK